ncbi:MAG: hypothetical protein KDD41_10105 [Flavobacteriales bacterium]|nr:hypothetical protein [Flavobacteriales bacterium]
MMPVYVSGSWLLANRLAEPQLFDVWVVEKPNRVLSRIVALPGEELSIVAGELRIDGGYRDWKNLRYAYRIWCTEEVQLAADSYTPLYKNRIYTARLTPSKADSTASIPGVRKLKKLTHNKAYFPSVFPHDPDYPWSRDYFGPLVVPGAGEELTLTKYNYKLYIRLILDEGGQLHVDGHCLFINGQETDRYVVKKDYYWVMCDNRHAAVDSRNFGFVARDELTGKAIVLFE